MRALFSIDRYNRDGVRVENGIFLHLGETSIRFANLIEFTAFQEQLARLTKNIRERYVGGLPVASEAPDRPSGGHNLGHNADFEAWFASEQPVGTDDSYRRCWDAARAPGTPIEKAARDMDAIARKLIHRLDISTAAMEGAELFPTMQAINRNVILSARASLSSLPQEPSPPDLDLEDLRKVLECVAQDGEDPCYFDHHGYCQAHGWMSTEECYVKTAQRLLESLPPEPEGAQEGAAGEGEPLPSVGGPAGLDLRILELEAGAAALVNCARDFLEGGRGAEKYLRSALASMEKRLGWDKAPEAAQPPLSPKGEGPNPSNPGATKEGAQEPKEGGRP